jgi:hypothetical protein
MSSKANLPVQKHPFDQLGKVFVNKEWYLALQNLVSQSNSGGSSENVSDVALLEAIDAFVGSEGNVERSIADVVALIHAMAPQDSTEMLIARLRELEIRVALLPDYTDPVLLFVDEKGSGGTPGFAAGVDFTAGTTTSLTLSRNYKTAAALWVAFDAAAQGPDQYSLSGKTLTFTSAIPTGTSKVFVKGFIQN